MTVSEVVEFFERGQHVVPVKGDVALGTSRLAGKIKTMRLSSRALLFGTALVLAPCFLLLSCDSASPADDDDNGTSASPGAGGTSGLGSGGTTGGAGTGAASGAGSGGVSAASGGGGVSGSAGTAASAGNGGTSSGGSSSGGVAGASAGGASGSAGVASGGTGGGSSGMGPTPPSATLKFPFPQNRRSSHCTYPSVFDNQDVKNVYDAWKADLVTSDGAGGFRRVKRPAEPGLNKDSTVSEGIAYGMMIAVYMDDQSLFDDLWKYSLAHTWQYTPQFGNPALTVLMNWYILADGNVSTQDSGGQDGYGAATDADEDMAWALVMANEQWGGQGSLSKSYLDSAKQMLGDIWSYEIDNNRLPKNGSSWGGDTSLNISYFAPAYYKVFAQVTGESRWASSVVDYVYQVIDNNLKSENGNQSNGLVPAWSQANGSPAEVGPGQGGLPYTYQYDSCRTPFRIGLDACFTGDTRAVGYVSKTSQFFAGITAPNIVDGYQLDGTPNPQYPSQYGGLSAAFIGPAGVGAMHSPSFQSFIDAAWGMLKQNNMWCGGQYYDESWTMMSMLMLTGNFLDYTQYP